MFSIHTFVFNPFQENTYLIWDETHEAIIIDPGCISDSETDLLEKFLENKKLKLQHNLNTHGHLDHIFGNRFLEKQYHLKPKLHKEDFFLLNSLPNQAEQYGLHSPPSPTPDQFLESNQKITFGHTTLQVLHLPGHSPGGVAFWYAKEKTLFSGDSLFRGTIGRTDLPKGDHKTLIKSLKTKLLTLPDDTVVYPGHGAMTTIGEEQKNNPYLKTKLQLNQ